MLIIGTGDHAHGLAHLFSINNWTSSSGNFLEVTKKNGPGKGGDYLHDTDVVIADFDDARRRP